MSAHIREALTDLEHDTSSVRLAPPAQVRARGEAWRRHRVTGGVATAVAGTVAVTIFGLAAVGGGSATSPPPVRVSPAASSPTAATEADCGKHVLRQAEELPDAVMACFLDAVAARRPVRLAETGPTVEGDPIHLYYVADATGAVQVTIDSRQDSYGSREVTRQTCAGPFADHGHIRFAQCSTPVPAWTLIVRRAPVSLPWSKSLPGSKSLPWAKSCSAPPLHRSCRVLTPSRSR